MVTDFDLCHQCLSWGVSLDCQGPLGGLHATVALEYHVLHVDEGMLRE